MIHFLISSVFVIDYINFPIFIPQISSFVLWFYFFYILLLFFISFSIFYYSFIFYFYFFGGYTILILRFLLLSTVSYLFYGYLFSIFILLTYLSKFSYLCSFLYCSSSQIRSFFIHFLPIFLSLMIKILSFFLDTYPILFFNSNFVL